MNSKTYNFSQIQEIYNTGLLQLLSQASEVHRNHHSYSRVYLNTLVSYKTGGCGEDCAYCAQSSRYQTHIDNKSIYLTVENAVLEAKKAKELGAERICISASWKNIPNDEKLQEIISIGKQIRQMGMKVCCTLGTVNEEQIHALKEAGFSAFNHNIDTSERFYPQIVTTRSYKDRLSTISLLQEHDMPWCSGGIIGMGETADDRLQMLMTLANQPKQPFSVPLNVLVPIKGTPLEHIAPVSHWEMIRLIATARILMPKTIICLAAGRENMSEEKQALCFLAGANSVFTGEKLLTTDNCNPDTDSNLFKILGMKTEEQNHE